jgi:hypothetical protein
MELVANVAKLPQKRLRAKSGFSKYTFSYDEKYVTIESSEGFDSGTRKYDLWRLIPQPATEQKPRPEATSQTRSGIAFLLAALVIYFSEFRWSLPLLVPVLTLVGLVELCIGWQRAGPRTFTHYFGSDGGALLSIPMDIIEGDRDAFIAGLTEAIRSARTEVYGTTAV